ncbi:hypothetical protein OG874_36985 [Nocardia sp. NBC_00565]|uniref:hypothetical protein n=1 Tax=Nocardia sp. NBC_00565 TaxID=2975993 RepID=UPI002E8191C5|nr:hypothetical protein [Nocardia sp. NBC_00565]WUC02271.1 hypothetical protein OG874_36985 [Nocardia sp. NBC_00565]
MPSSTSPRLMGCLLPLAAVILMVGGFAAYVKLLSWYEDSHPPAAAPPDLCAAIGSGLFERLVPDGVPESKAIYSSGPDAACEYYTAEDRPIGSDSYGFLGVRLLRYGQVGWDSGAERAADALVESCAGSSVAGQFHTTSGLGDAACAVDSDEGEGGTGKGSAVVRRGADLFWVNFYTHPGTAEQARQAVTETALAALQAVR